jgi:hypothetical protein
VVGIGTASLSSGRPVSGCSAGALIAAGACGSGAYFSTQAWYVIHASTPKMAQIKSRWLSMYFLFLPGFVVPGLSALLPVAVEAIKNLLVIAVSRCRLVYHHHIMTAECCLVLAKRLANDPFYPVSRGCRPAVLFRNRHA